LALRARDIATTCGFAFTALDIKKSFIHCQETEDNRTMDSDSDAYMDDAMSASEDDFMASEDDEPVKMIVPKKRGGVLASKENALNSVPLAEAKTTSTKGTSKKTVEEIYQKKTQLEHILLRPDTYSKFW
jgi:hypothetical protein